MEGRFQTCFLLNSVKHIISTRRRENGLNCNGISCPPFIVQGLIHRGSLHSEMERSAQNYLRLHCITWSKAWFSKQHCSEDSYNQLHTAVSKLNCPKALGCFYHPLDTGTISA